MLSKHKQNSFRRAATCIARLLFVVCLVLATTAISFAAPRQTQNAPAREYEVKAGFLFNFAKFIEWPANEAAPNRSFTLGVLGSDPFGDTLDAMEGKNGR